MLGSLRAWLGRLPLLWLFVYYTVGFAVLSFVLDLILYGKASFPRQVGEGLLFAAVLTPFAWWSRRRTRHSGGLSRRGVGGVGAGEPLG